MCILYQVSKLIARLINMIDSQSTMNWSQHTGVGLSYSITSVNDGIFGIALSCKQLSRNV